MSLDGFLPWFFGVFLPPLMPLVVAITIAVSIVFWSTVIVVARRRLWRH